MKLAARPSFSFPKLFSARYVSRARNGNRGPNAIDDASSSGGRKAPAQGVRRVDHFRPIEPPPRRRRRRRSVPGGADSIMARFRSHQRKKSARSIVSEDPWKVDTPFGPPRISSFPGGGGIRRIRNTLSKLSPSARAERELLRQKNRYKIPLTERNMDTFVSEQEFTAACNPDQHTNELQVAAWLDRLSY